jgi:hypothetical protein
MPVALAAAVFAVGFYAFAQDEKPEKLTVLWTSDDPDVAENVALMYTHAAKTQGWFDEVQLIVWGPSQKLLVADKDIQNKIKAMSDDGIVVEACVACASGYGLVESIRRLGYEVKPMGEPLTQRLKSDAHVVTF